MKKLLMAFVTAALLTVCLCVPAFAAEETCDHSSGNDIFLYEGNTHYMACLDCGTYVYFNDSHPDLCFDGYAEYPFIVFSSGAFSCSHYTDILTSGNFDGIKMYHDSQDHYFQCPDCLAIIPYSFSGSEALPHSDDCVFCPQFLSSGFVDYGSLSSIGSGFEILPTITALVTASIDWLTAIATCIVSTPLLLCFVIVSFVGLGVGLIKRVIHL